MTEHNTIILPASEYKNLVIQDVRCAILEGLLRKQGYINTDEIMVVLGIEETEKENG